VEKFKYAHGLTDRRRKEDQRLRETLLIWLSFWRDVLVRASQASTPLVNVDRNEEISRLAQGMGLPRARALVTQHEKAVQQKDANVNERLLLEVLFLDLPRLK
jgi:hypothetical protein